MPTPPLNKQEWTRRKAVIEDALRKGHPPPGIGAASVSVTADVDRGEGEKPLALSLAELNGLPSPEASAIVIDSVTVG